MRDPIAVITSTKEISASIKKAPTGLLINGSHTVPMIIWYMMILKNKPSMHHCYDVEIPLSVRVSQ
jgi:hypothetical protein